MVHRPWGFRKAGRVWYGGVRETREPQVTIERTVSKIEATENLPAFQGLSGTPDLSHTDMKRPKNSFHTL